MSDKEIIEVDDSTWEQLVERAPNPSVVMFYSPLCPHCLEMEPFFEEYAREFKEKAIFVKINVLNNAYTTTRYGIMGTPTFKFFCAGRPVQELVGVVYPPLLKKTIEDVMKFGHDCVKKSTKIDHRITGYA